MKIRLELAHKKAKVKKVLLNADTIIGRSTECGLRIASNEVSRQHCKICIGEEGVTVRDLGSSNGTFVNGYQLEPDTDYEIAPDSELSLGGIKFFVRFSEPPEKVMQSDGLGSTVDLKPSQKEELAALQKAAPEAAPDEEETHFAEATESDVESPIEEEVAEAAWEDKQEPEWTDAGGEEAADEEATVNMERPADAGSVMDEADYEMSTHGDSAILEREEIERESEAVASDESEDEVIDLDLDEPEILEDAEEEVGETEEPVPTTAEDEVVDLELDEDSEPAAEDEVVDLELDEESPPEEALDEEMDEEAAVEADSEEEPVAVAEEEINIPEPADEEMSEDDVAAFLNQVSDEDDAADNEEDESLGDFFKQFD